MARIRLEKAYDVFQEHALAAARAPYDYGRLSRIYGKIDPIQHFIAVKRFVDVYYLYHIPRITFR
jgi:hypothetical protein